jgi:hypothetical protein
LLCYVVSGHLLSNPVSAAGRFIEIYRGGECACLGKHCPRAAIVLGVCEMKTVTTVAAIIGSAPRRTSVTADFVYPTIAGHGARYSGLRAIRPRRKLLLELCRFARATLTAIFRWECEGPRYQQGEACSQPPAPSSLLPTMEHR